MIIFPFQTKKLTQDIHGKLRILPFGTLYPNGFRFIGECIIHKYARIKTSGITDASGGNGQNFEISKLEK